MVGIDLWEHHDRDVEDRLVRPFIVTQGRTRPDGLRVPVEAAVSQSLSSRATEPELGPTEMQIWLAAARQPSSAELAAQFDLPLGVVLVLVADLVTAGLAELGLIAQPGDIEVVRRLIDGIRRL
jgi:hypothetical protein